jgi:hypothetical protein
MQGRLFYNQQLMEEAINRFVRGELTLGEAWALVYPDQPLPASVAINCIGAMAAYCHATGQEATHARRP